MANTTSAKRAVRQIARRTVVNTARRSRVRTCLRTVEEAIVAGDATAAKAALKVAEPELMRAVGKGVFHKNTAARKMSRLSRSVKALK
ncbi:MAG: 30S ribosomal protein S20 [Robiginitomaculum sp.]|nr:MAG: 30S ribosomal protein S20 [Robiginitomaculum sp.]